MKKYTVELVATTETTWTQIVEFEAEDQEQADAIADKLALDAEVDFDEDDDAWHPDGCCLTDGVYGFAESDEPEDRAAREAITITL
jgi:hypothetical protein